MFLQPWLSDTDDAPFLDSVLRKRAVKVKHVKRREKKSDKKVCQFLPRGSLSGPYLGQLLVSIGTASVSSNNGPSMGCKVTDPMLLVGKEHFPECWKISCSQSLLAMSGVVFTVSNILYTELDKGGICGFFKNLLCFPLMPRPKGCVEITSCK